MAFDEDVRRWMLQASQAQAKIMPPVDYSSGKPRRVPGWTVKKGIEHAREAAQAWTRVYEAVSQRTGDAAIVPSQYARDMVTNGLIVLSNVPGAVARRE